MPLTPHRWLLHGFVMKTALPPSTLWHIGLRLCKSSTVRHQHACTHQQIGQKIPRRNRFQLDHQAYGEVVENSVVFDERLLFDERRRVIPTTKGSNPETDFVALQQQTFHNTEGVATAGKMPVEFLRPGSCQGRTSPRQVAGRDEELFQYRQFYGPAFTWFLTPLFATPILQTPKRAGRSDSSAPNHAQTDSVSVRTHASRDCMPR